jgi:hypothetical protein
MKIKKSSPNCRVPAVKLEQPVSPSISVHLGCHLDSLGEAIKQLTCVEYDSHGKIVCTADRQNMVPAARGLLSAVTRVLLLADMIVIKQIISVKKKVSDVTPLIDAPCFSVKVISTLNRLEAVVSSSEFIKLFAIYGTQMVDLAHLTGDRQNVIEINARARL